MGAWGERAGERGCHNARCICHEAEFRRVECVQSDLLPSIELVSGLQYVHCWNVRVQVARPARSLPTNDIVIPQISTD